MEPCRGSGSAYEIMLPCCPCCYPYLAEEKNFVLNRKWGCYSVRKNMWLLLLKKGNGEVK